MTLEELYEQARDGTSAVAGHCWFLRNLASQVDEVVEFGTGDLVSATAILAGQPKRFTTYDVKAADRVPALAELSGATEFRAIVQSSLEVEPVACDLLFIDTCHTGRQLYAELTRHGDGVRQWIAMHDTEAFAMWDEWFREPGLWPAIWRWQRDHGEWRTAYVTRDSCGLTLLERIR